MTLTLAAVGAVIAAVLELTLWPYLAIGEAHVHFVFVYVIVLAVVGGMDVGITTGFVGGLAIDFLAPRPLGSTAFALLVCAALAVAIGRVLTPVRYIAPMVAVLVLGFLYSLIVVALYRALAGPIQIADPIGTLLPGVILDTLLAAIIGPLAVLVRVRRAERERVDW